MILNICLGEADEMPSGDDTESVINIVDAHRLKEINLDKKAFMGYIKGTYI